jgi:hypothetical protein
MTVFYAINLAFLAVSLVARAGGYAVGDQVLGAITVAPTMSTLVQAALCIAMTVYFHTSVRVKNTFFRRAA